MNTINLFLLSRVDEEQYTNTYRALSGFEDSVHKSELMCIRKLSEELMKQGLKVNELDDFWYSYKIPHISKEFDLMKIELGKKILNLELKTGETNLSRIKKQLIQNKSYLKHLKTNVVSFTYVAKLDELYFLSGDKLIPAKFDQLAKEIVSFGENLIRENLDDYFRPSLFLVSPLTSSDKFLNGEYFLTEQQRVYRDELLENIESKTGVTGITGAPGTGKTLFLYDTARLLAESKNVLIIHGASLCDGHRAINDSSVNITVKCINDVTDSDYEKYDYIFIDELQRIINELKPVLDKYSKNKLFIVSYDHEQVLDLNDSFSAVHELENRADYYMYKLTNLFRINKQVAAYYRHLFDKKDEVKPTEKFDNIDVLYAKNSMEAEMILEYYSKNKGYTYIINSCDRCNSLNNENGYTANEIIGQEFDRVITTIDKDYYYKSNGELASKHNELNKYSRTKLLYQIITRTREKLCILVVDNLAMYEELLNLKLSKQ